MVQRLEQFTSASFHAGLRSSERSSAFQLWLAFAIVCGSAAPVGCVPRERLDESGSKVKPSVAIENEADVEPAPAPALDPEAAGTNPASAATESAGAAPTPVAPATAPSPPAPSNSVEGAADLALTTAFSDDFNRSTLGSAWRATSNAWTLIGGQLCGENARNHPVWLARRLPTNAVIEFQAMSSSNDGDLKAEFWGDGRSSASGQSYTDATSYLTIFGGWKNTFHVLARLDEHASSRREIKLTPEGADFISKTVVPNQKYQFQVERRDGRTVRWLVDDMEISTYRDPEPLSGLGHEHFGFNDWQVKVCFDNLRVTPLRD